MADVAYFYSSKLNDSLLIFRSDTVTFLPVHSRVETRYGFDCPGIKYQNSKNRLYRIIEFGGTDCNFAKLDSSVTRKTISIDSLLLLDHIRKSY